MNKGTQVAIGQSVRLLMCLLTLTAASNARAHEMGTMKVTALFSSDGRYQIDVVLDPEHLPSGLYPADGNPAAVHERFLQDVRISFDGQEAQAAEVPLPRDAEEGTGSRKTLVRLGGAVPAGAHSFTWSHRAASGTYLLGSRNEGDPETGWQWLEGPATSQPFALRHAPTPLTRWEVIRLYLCLGYTHILPGGVDHILFVLGLFLLSLRRRTLFAQITAFTIAHSLTLGLTIYGVVSLSPKIVEPLIALSIVYVAVENLLLSEARPWRLAVVFCFGLLHGMGFAGVLRELGLPRSEFLTALVSFNAGVEAGQLTVVLIAFLAIGFWFRSKPWYRAYLASPASASIAVVGLYWTVQRVLLGLK